MASGGKGGSQSTQVQLPGFIEDAAKRAISRGDAASEIGFTPYSGPDVAAFTPLQEASFASTNQAADAFGLPLAMGSNLPEAQNFGGVMGYSSRPIYDQAIGVLADERPGQYAAINAPFIDPVSGSLATPTVTQPVNAQVVPSYQSNNDEPERFAHRSAGGGGGYTGFRDMFDGGGAGASGDTFQGGGLLSDVANRSIFKGLL